MDPFVQQLAELCRTHVVRAKWVVVPSHALGRTLGERLAREGTDWLNLRFVTPLDLAARMGAPFLVERGIDPSEEGLGPALVMRLLLALPEKGGYFRQLADQPTLAGAMWAAIREVRMAGLRARDLTPEAFASRAKYEELRALLESYETFLAASGRADMATLYQEALAHADWCPVRPEDLWTALPRVVWSPLQERLLDSLPGERIVPRTRALHAVDVPRRLRHEHVEPIEARPEAAPLTYLREPGASGAGAEPAPVALFHAGGREAEIEEVFRRVLALGVPLDQVEIACASDAHLALVWEKALRHDLPVTLGPGIPAAQTRPGRALIGLCDWIETDFSAGHVRRLLQSGDLGIEEDDEGFTASQAARILARAEAGWGRDTYRLALGRLEKEYAATAADPDESDEDRAYAQERADLTKAVRTWICDLIAAIPGPSGGAPSQGRLADATPARRGPASAGPTVNLAPVVDAALEFLERTAARKSALDHRAAAAIADHVEELRALGSFSCTLREALRFLRERVAGVSVAPDRPRPGHLFAGTLAQACYSGRLHLFVVGLEEGRVFPGGTEDAVLLDAERAALSPALRLASDRIDEAVFTTLARLASWSPRSDHPQGGTVTFSYSCRDTREFRETYASWLVLQAFRLQQGDPAASYQQMKAALGEPKSLVPHSRDVAIAPAGWWMKSVVGTGDSGAARLDGRFPFLARGRVAAARRASDAFTEYDGYVPAAGLLLDPCSPDVAFSVTDLEGAAACPFRLFLKRGLGIRPVDARERDRDVWLDPMTKGSELHDLYALALRRCRDEGRGVDLDRDLPWLLDTARERLRVLNEEMPAATDEILERESQEFLADVELFLRAEATRKPGRTPVAFEVSFGRPLGDDEEPLAREEPVAITLGGGLTFRIAGRIDRIDRVGDAFEVIDYKTGGLWRDDWKGTFNGGRRLQHALYGLAAVELLKTIDSKPTVVKGVYYFSSHKGRGERIDIARPPSATIAAVLADLRDGIRGGGFVHARTDGPCKFCDYAGACDGPLKNRAEEKLEEAVLQAFGRLGTHA